MLVHPRMMLVHHLLSGRDLRLEQSFRFKVCNLLRLPILFGRDLSPEQFFSSNVCKLLRLLILSGRYSSISLYDRYRLSRLVSVPIKSRQPSFFFTSNHLSRLFLKFRTLRLVRFLMESGRSSFSKFSTRL